MRKLVTTTALLMLGAVITPSQAQADHDGLVNDPDKEAEFVTMINDLRQSEGLDTLEVHEQLAAKARDWSHTMAEAGEIWHSELPDGITVDWKRLGENVGMGGSVEALHQAFIDSPGHYQNLIDPGFRHVGLGVTVDADGTIFVSEVFMELASQPAPAASKPAAGTPNSSDDGPVPADQSPDEERTRTLPIATTSDDVGEPAPPEPSPRLSSVLTSLRALDG